MIDRGTCKTMLRESARLMLEHAERLSDIDSRFGDGDHGITVTKIAKLVNERIEAWDDASIKDFLDDLGMDVMAVRGGSEMQDITTAQVGDKTMMDALIPAVKAAQACAAPDDGPVDVLMAAAEAAEEGARASEGFASKFGRARSYGDRTIGTPDAGAVSTSLFLRGLANGASLPRS